MANTFAPYGFLQYQGGAGGAPTRSPSQPEKSHQATPRPSTLATQ